MEGILLHYSTYCWLGSPSISRITPFSCNLAALYLTTPLALASLWRINKLLLLLPRLQWKVKSKYALDSSNQHILNNKTSLLQAFFIIFRIYIKSDSTLLLRIHFFRHKDGLINEVPRYMYMLLHKLRNISFNGKFVFFSTWNMVYIILCLLTLPLCSSYQDMSSHIDCSSRFVRHKMLSYFLNFSVCFLVSSFLVFSAVCNTSDF